MAQFKTKEEYEKWKADRAVLAKKEERSSSVSVELNKLPCASPDSISKPRSIKIVSALIIIYALFAIAISAGSFILYNFLPENSKAEFLAKSRPFEASTVDQFSSKVIGIVLMPFLIYVIIFYGTSFFIYILVAIICKFGWFFFWRKNQRKYDLVRSYYLCLVASIIASAFELLFLILILSFELRIALFAVTYGTVLGGIYAFGLFNTPLACELVDESAERIDQNKKEKTVSEISGSYFGINQFMLSFGQAIASIFVGFFLIGANAESPFVITFVMASGGLFYLFALIYLIKMRKK